MTGSIFDGIDMSDPCAVWPKLQEAVHRMLAGESVASVRMNDREVTFSRSNLAALQQEIGKLQAACNAKLGKARPRYAIRAGFRSR